MSFINEGLNFVCRNLPDACSVEFTNHSWKTNRQNHSFIIEAKLKV